MRGSSLRVMLLSKGPVKPTVKFSPASRRFQGGRQYIPRLGDRWRGVPGVCGKGEEQGFAGGEMVEDRGQKSEFAGRHSQILQANAGQS